MKQKLFFEKVNKINKFLANLTKMRKVKTQINKIRNEKGKIITNSKEIYRIIRNYFENLISNKLENLEDFIQGHRDTSTYAKTKSM
jgi:hypothetical protein